MSATGAEIVSSSESDLADKTIAPSASDAEKCPGGNYSLPYGFVDLNAKYQLEEASEPPSESESIQVMVESSDPEDVKPEGTGSNDHGLTEGKSSETAPDDVSVSSVSSVMPDWTKPGQQKQHLVRAKKELPKT